MKTHALIIAAALCSSCVTPRGAQFSSPALPEILLAASPLEPWLQLNSSQVVSNCGAGRNCTSSRFRAGDGTAALPAYSWTADIDTGIWRSGANEFSFSNGGTRALRFSGNGQIRGDTDNSLLDLRSSVGASLSYSTSSVTVAATEITFDPSSGYISSRGAQRDTRANRPFTVEDADGALAAVGTTYAGLATCDANHNSAQQWDTTNNEWRYCRQASTVWVAPNTIDKQNITAYFPGLTALLNNELVTFEVHKGTVYDLSATYTGRVSYITPVVVGVGAGTVTFDLYDETAGASRDACTMNCTQAVGTPLSCGTGVGALTSTNVHSIRMTNNGCGTLPIVNITAEIYALKI